MPNSDPLHVPHEFDTGRPTSAWHVYFYNRVSGECQRFGLRAPDGELAERWAWHALSRKERERLSAGCGMWTKDALQRALDNWRRTVLVQNPRQDLDEDEGDT